MMWFGSFGTLDSSHVKRTVAGLTFMLMFKPEKKEVRMKIQTGARSPPSPS